MPADGGLWSSDFSLDDILSYIRQFNKFISPQRAQSAQRFNRNTVLTTWFDMCKFSPNGWRILLTTITTVILHSWENYASFALFAAKTSRCVFVQLTILGLYDRVALCDYGGAQCATLLGELWTFARTRQVLFSCRFGSVMAILDDKQKCSSRTQSAFRRQIWYIFADFSRFIVK